MILNIWQHSLLKMAMGQRRWRVAYAMGLALFGTLGLQRSTVAQIAPDGTLSTTATSGDSINFVIAGGDRTGDNLFHSFEDFSIPSDGSAAFQHDLDIVNIINRVTGNAVSTIDGTLQAEGNANVFLLNPNGIMVGPNATLNIGGSFVATTADRLVFEDDSVFSASPRQTSPLLTISAPIGLQMGRSPGSITLEGNGHGVVHSVDYFPVQNPISSPSGLQVNSNESLALIGSGLTLAGAILTAPSGHVELGSVASGTVYFDDAWQFDYREATDVQDIHLSQRSLVDVGDRQAGSVRLYGSTVQLESGATLLSQQSGDRPGGSIVIDGTDAVHLRGTAPGGTPRTQVRTEASGGGQGGSIQVSAPLLQVRGGSALVTTTSGEAPAGDIVIQDTDRVNITGFSNLAPGRTESLSVIGTLALGAEGNAGKIQVTADELVLRNGGSIASLTFLGSGNGGNIDINVPSIRLQGISPRVSVAGISSATLGEGNAGDIDIQTHSLLVRNGALVDSSSLAQGNAGNINIVANDSIQISGFALTDLDVNGIVGSKINSVTSPVSSSSVSLPGVPSIPIGDAGRIYLQTPSLLVEDRGQVSIGTQGPGNSGEIRIAAETIQLNNRGHISATVSTGQGGDILLNTNRLMLDNGLINASVLDTGEGGNITINATDSIEMIGAGSQALLFTVGVPILTGEFNDSFVTQGIWAIAADDGTPGEIKLRTNALSLIDGSIISTMTFGSEPGGAINIQDAQFIDVQASAITSSSFNRENGGNAGEIHVETDRLLLRDGGELLATTLGTGDGGNVVVNASESIIAQGRLPFRNLVPSGLYADTQNDATGNGGDLSITTPLFVIQDEAELSARSGTNLLSVEEILPQTFGNSRRNQRGQSLSHPRQGQNLSNSIAGTIDATIGLMVLDQGKVFANSRAGEGGNITYGSLKIKAKYLIIRSN